MSNINISANSSIRTIKTLNSQSNGKSGVSNASKQYQLKKYAEATLGPSYLKAAVKLPQGEDKVEWLAMNTVDFFNQINLLYGTISEFCTKKTCPQMSAGSKFTYNWADESTQNRPVALSAPEYVDNLMSWIQAQLDNDELFPTRTGVSFDKGLMPIFKTIFKRMYRVYAHIYHHHFEHVIVLNQEVHLNTSFKHFMFLVEEFGLIEDPNELLPMDDLVATFHSDEPSH